METLKMTKKQIIKAIKDDGCIVTHQGGNLYRADCPWGRIIIKPLAELYDTIFGVPVEIIGSGRRSVDGRQHLWKVPSDLEPVIKQRGTAWVWQCCRSFLAVEKSQEQ